MFYVAVIIICNVVIIMGNALFQWERLWYFAFCSVFGTVAVIAIDGVTAFLVRSLPEKYFAPGNKIFFVSERERKFYRKNGIKEWKKYVPELGGFTGFHKDKLGDPRDKKYLARFLVESNYGVIIHIINALFGFLILLLPFSSRLSIGIPVATVNFVLSLLPTALLRFNTPPLLRLYERAAK